MNDVEARVLREMGRPASNEGARQTRAAGAPLPMGASSRPTAASDDLRYAPVPPPGRTLPNPAESVSDQDAPGLQWAMNALLRAVPFVQRIMPLLEGNLSATQLSQRTAQGAPQVDLAPLEEGLTELETQQHELRNQIVEQNSSLKRVEDQLEMVREATDRNTLEQQELLEDLKTVGGKVNIFAFVLLALLAVSILINVVLLVHLNRVLP
jgi:hypothetical protein